MGGPIAVAPAGCNEQSNRLAVPRRGHVLSTIVEIYGNPLREAVATLASSLARKYCSSVRASLFIPSGKQSEQGVIRSDADMAAWAIVSMWVVAIATKVLPSTASLAEAEQWFFGLRKLDRLTKLLTNEALRKAERLLRSEAEASAYFELLPYILDPHGPGSRLSVRRNPATRAARTRKRAQGIFYTPADVAEYMASVCIEELSPERPPTIFDPACGTGVFLRAALQELRRRHPQKNAFTLAADCLFGVDIDPWPLDAAAFVLLADSWIDLAEQTKVPAEAWHRLRQNLVCIDALHIDPAGDVPQVIGKNAQKTSYHVPGKRLTVTQYGFAEVRRTSISQLFPALECGPTVILGNPPYADIGLRPDLPQLERVYETLSGKARPNAEIYPLFIEQMIRLANEEICSGALVLPLSIACNIGKQFSITRELISQTRGRWRFVFFDREPHALFGEDVKTRNAIILWSRGPSEKTAVVATGPLRKWRSGSRAAMFRNLQFTVVDSDIRDGIPKIEGAYQVTALRTLSKQYSCLEQAVRGIERFKLAQTPNADDRMVFVGSTAYNFLNVFLRPQRDLLRSGKAFSENLLHAVTCPSREDALAVFAILSSHFTYWWWRTHGDGFHVSRRFIAELPLGREVLTGRVARVLSEYGAELWSAIKANPIISLNRGRTSLAYTPNGHDDIRRRIDNVLSEHVGLEGAFVDELQKFTARTVAATLCEHTIMENKEKDA